MKKKLVISLYDEKYEKKICSIPFPFNEKILDNSKTLTKSQKKQLKNIIKKEVSDLKKHFNDGAWDLCSNGILDSILMEFLGFDLFAVLTAEICTKCEVAWGSRKNRDKNMYMNEKDKVFYRPNGNKLYIDKKARNVNMDIQLGDL